MSGFTPGPWTIHEIWGARTQSTINGARIYAGDLHVASISREADKPLAQKYADARLIIAAPDLVATLQECERILKFAFEEGALPEETVMGLCIDPYGVLADLRAALARATGG